MCHKKNYLVNECITYMLYYENLYNFMTANSISKIYSSVCCLINISHDNACMDMLLAKAISKSIIRN